MFHFAPKLRQLAQRPITYPKVDKGDVLYVIGDIHGRADCLAAAHRMIDQDRRGHAGGRPSTEIYLGDYIDRGPDSKGVIDLLLARQRLCRSVFLRGNHEIMMSAFLDGQMPFQTWSQFGGAATLLSYGVDRAAFRCAEDALPGVSRARVPAAHIAFLEQLASYHVHGGYCFVHAGLRPDRAVPDQSLDDLAWIRGEFLMHKGDFGFVVVHGHTPVPEIEFRGNRINIDTGAYRSNRLSVLKIAEGGPLRLEASMG